MNLRRSFMKRLSFLFAISFILSSCGDDAEKPGRDGFDGRVPNFEGICADSEGSVQVIGQWAGIANLSVELAARSGSLVALCPNPQIQPAELVMLINLTEGDDESTMVELQLCDLELPTILAGVGSCPSDPSRVLELAILPSDALAELLPTLRILFDSGLATEITAGDDFIPDSFVEVLGVELEDPTGPLPFWDETREKCGLSGKGSPADCVEGYELIEDADGDGNLGVTLFANSGAGGLVEGEAYTTIRLAPQLRGRIRNDACIEGTIALNLDFTIVDSRASVSGIVLSTPLLNANIPPLNFLEDSRFKLIRADSAAIPFDDDGDGVITCEEVRNNRGNFLR